MKARLARTHKGPCCDYLHSQQGLQLNFSRVPPFVYALKPDGGLKVTTLLQLTQGLGKQKKYNSMASMTRKWVLGCICSPWAFFFTFPHVLSLPLYWEKKDCLHHCLHWEYYLIVLCRKGLRMAPLSILLSTIHKMLPLPMIFTLTL